MKKIASLLLAFTLPPTLFACGNTETDQLTETVSADALCSRTHRQGTAPSTSRKAIV